MEIRVRKSYVGSFLRQEFGGRCLQLKQSQSSRMNLSKVFILRFSISLHEVFFFSRQENCRNEQCIFLLRVVFRRKWRICMFLLLNCWYIVECLDVVVIKQKIVDENFCLFIIFPFLLMVFKRISLATYDWLTACFCFAVLFERLLCGCFMHSTDVIFVVKIHVRMVLFWETNWCDCWCESDFCWDV